MASEKETAGKSKMYPSVSMTEAFEVCEKSKKYPLKKPISYTTLADDYGLKNTNTKSFKYKISTAKQLGLIATTGNTLTLTDWGSAIAHPTSEQETQMIRKLCFGEPPLYKELISLYNGKALPNVTSLSNLLVRDYQIMENAKTTAAKIFLDMAQEADVVKAGVLSYNIDKEAIHDEPMPQKEVKPIEEMSPHAPEAEISCFKDTVSGYEPLIVPLGQQRKAMLYMPSDATKEEAEYVKSMIEIMFKQLYTKREE